MRKATHKNPKNKNYGQLVIHNVLIKCAFTNSKRLICIISSEFQTQTQKSVKYWVSVIERIWPQKRTTPVLSKKSCLLS
jgi:hypothetical protein